MPHDTAQNISKRVSANGRLKSYRVYGNALNHNALRLSLMTYVRGRRNARTG